MALESSHNPPSRGQGRGEDEDRAEDRGAPEKLSLLSLPAEIRLRPGHDWYDFDAKYLDDACDFDVPARLSAELTDRVRATAVAAFEALDCAGLARVDFFVTPDEQVVVNEVNTIPGFTPISMFPRLWALSGVPYPELLDRLIEHARARHQRRARRAGRQR